MLINKISVIYVCTLLLAFLLHDVIFNLNTDYFYIVYHKRAKPLLVITDYHEVIIWRIGLFLSVVAVATWMILAGIHSTVSRCTVGYIFYDPDNDEVSIILFRISDDKEFKIISGSGFEGLTGGFYRLKELTIEIENKFVVQKNICFQCRDINDIMSLKSHFV